MKNIYATLLTTSALLLAGSSMAQSHSKTGRTERSLQPGHISAVSNSHSTSVRGGGAPANDECSAAEALTLVATADCASSLVTGNNGASTISTGDPTCDGSTAGYQDVWYSFNSGSHTTVSIDMVNVDGTDWAFTVQPTCDPGAEIACEINPSAAVEVDVTANTDYYIRVYANTDFGNGGEFTLCASYGPDIAAPDNDECAGAIALTPGVSCNPVAGTTAGATQSMAPILCNGFTSPNAKDVWYSFTATSTSDTIVVEGLDTFDAVLEFFSGDCATLSSMGCEDDNFPQGAPVTERMFVSGLTVGSTYYVRVYDYGHLSTVHEFNICIVEGGIAPPAPVNDDCTGVVPEDITVGDPPHMFSGDNTGATEDGGTGFIMVWHAFTTTECANISINYCVPGFEFDNFLVNLAVQCPDFITGVLTGVNDTCTVSFQELAAGTYYIPVMVEAGTTPIGPYSIEVTASTCAPPPANDDCAGAMALTPATMCNPVAGTSAGATQSMDPVLCNAFTSPNANDVWYSFTATTASDSILVEGIDTFDAVIEIFSGDCGNLTSLACEDSNFPQGTPVTERMFISGLTIGSVYYVRVYDYAHASADHNFNICVMEDGTIGIQDAAAPEFSFYPNPTQGDITISGADLSGRVDFELTDMTGRVVYKDQKSMNAGQPVTLALNGKLALGTYSLRVITANGISSRPVMIK